MTHAAHFLEWLKMNTQVMTWKNRRHI